MSACTLTELELKLNRRLASAIADGITPGAVLAISMNGGRDRRVLVRGNHTFDGTSEMMIPNSLIDLASFTKFFVMAMIHALRCKGLVKLSDPLSKFFGSSSEISPELGNVTLGEIMTHQVYFFVPEGFDNLKGHAVLQTLLETRIARGGFRYGNLGYVIAGKVVEIITKMNLQEAFRDLIGTPLGGLNIKWWTHLNGDDQTMVVPTSLGPRPKKASAHDKLTRNIAHETEQLCGVAGTFGPASDVINLLEAINDSGIPESKGNMIFGHSMRNLLTTNAVVGLPRFNNSGDLQPLDGNFPEFAEAGVNLLPPSFTRGDAGHSTYGGAAYTGQELLGCPALGLCMVLLTNAVINDADPATRHRRSMAKNPLRNLIWSDLVAHATSK